MENKIKFGAIVYESESKMPQLEIKFSLNENNYTYYLAPFRGYSFQVSGSISGDGDYGASTVVGLGNLIDIQPNVPIATDSFSAFSSNIPRDSYGKEFMYSLAVTALYKFMWSYDLSPAKIGGFENNEFDNFVNACYAYIKEITESYR